MSFVPPNDASTLTQKHALHVWPQTRNRQPRRFPAARPVDPVVRLFWDGVQADAAAVAALQALAADTSYVGHSASLTRCKFDFTDQKLPLDSAVPARRSVYPGRLDALVAAFGQGRRPAPGEWVLSSPVAGSKRPQSHFDGRWLIFELDSGAEGPDLRATAIVAKAIRTMLVACYVAESAGADVPEVLSGRAPGGQPSLATHLAVVPLAFVGAPHADGHVLGFGLVPPRGSGLLEDAKFLAVLRRLAPFDPEAERRVLSLDVGEKTLNLRLFPTYEPAARSLDSASYSLQDGRPCRTFATVTPIVLNRFPKGTGVARDEDMANQVAEACQHIGLPRPFRTRGDSPRAVVPGNYSALSGVPPAYPSGPAPGWTSWRLPSHLAGRPLTHAVVQFEEPVEGPVILGAGRYHGLGLLRPIPDWGASA